MPVRKITKADRVKLVTWIRSGANVATGIGLYASMPGHNARLVSALNADPKAYERELHESVCVLLEISISKFENIKTKYHGKKTIEPARHRTVDRKITAEIREPRKPRAFREDWPFLSRPDCPPQLKALAADKISCWERYTANHKKLFDCNSLEECAAIAHEIVKDYKENRLIYDEMEHYKQHGAVLGLHPVFGHYKRFEKLRGMDVVELVKLHEYTLPHRIWRIKSEIEKGTKPHLKAAREKRLFEVESELAEIKRLLGK
jgi:hypothetical protein